MRASNSMGALALAFVMAGSLGAAPAAAWTRPGHMVIAAIAFDDLEATDPAVIDRVVDLCGFEKRLDAGPEPTDNIIFSCHHPRQIDAIIISIHTEKRGGFDR